MDRLFSTFHVIFLCKKKSGFDESVAKAEKPKKAKKHEKLYQML